MSDVGPPENQRGGHQENQERYLYGWPLLILWALYFLRIRTELILLHAAEAMRWSDAGLDAVETREITVELSGKRGYQDFKASFPPMTQSGLQLLLNSPDRPYEIAAFYRLI